MKTSVLLVLMLGMLPGIGGEAPLKGEVLKGWGITQDPAADCQFAVVDEKLTITVPGSPKAHDLSSELNNILAPRVVQSLTGDFRIQVRVDGEFKPGGESTQAGRTGYCGAGLIVFADANNFVRIERATLQSGRGPAVPYTNFEIRVDGQLQSIGTTRDLPTENGKPTWLRLERKGKQIFGGMSQDGENWSLGNTKELSSKAWASSTVLAGVAAISTSKMPFSPVYSNISVTQGTGTPREKSAERTEPKVEARPEPKAEPLPK